MICTKCGYERPNGYKGNDKDCPLCHNPYGINQIVNTNEPGKVRNVVPTNSTVPQGRVESKQMRATGKLTGIGKIGIGLGALCLFAFFKTGEVKLLLGGIVFLVGSFTHARRTVQWSHGSQEGSHSFSMIGVQDHLEVFEDKLVITPLGVVNFLNRGFKGTKTIPIESITAIQFKEAGAAFMGYIKFTILGATESKVGLLAAVKDENAFMFATVENNRLATEVKEFIEARMKRIHVPNVVQPQGTTSLSDELQKLDSLRNQGILSDQEFQSAKKKIIG